MIKRIDRLDESSWALYPKFRNRVEEFSIRNCPEFNPQVLLHEMDVKWITTPRLAGYWVGLCDGEIYAHFASWIHVNHGKNELYIYQAEADRNFANFDLLWPQVQRWIKSLNADTDVKDEQKVKTFEFTTPHRGELWRRYFERKGLKTDFRAVVRGDIL